MSINREFSSFLLLLSYSKPLNKTLTITIIFHTPLTHSLTPTTVVFTAIVPTKQEMNDRSPSPASSSSSSTAVSTTRRRHHHHQPAVEEECGDPISCTGKSCQSCTAGVIGGCVAVCCCPCAVVNFFALAFFKLPWAVARKCIARRKRRKFLEEKKKRGEIGISENGRTTLEIVVSSPRGVVGNNEEFGDEFKGEDVWLELYNEVGHLGFGRVSFTGNIPCPNNNNNNS